MKTTFKQRWEQLSARDQKTLKVGGIILAVFLLLQVVWWPLYHRISLLQAQISAEQSLIEWMIPRVAQLLEARKSGASMHVDKSLSGLEKSLQQAGLKPYVTEFSQNAQQHISIVFVDVPFESCMEWLEQVQSQGWVVQSMEAARGEKNGIVQLHFVLS